MQEITKDMTVGKPGKLIFSFAISLMLGNLFQQLYTFVDTIIVGKCLGINALAAVGATEWLTFMMFGCVQGITQGFSIGISQKFGRHDWEGVRSRIVHAIYLSMIIVVFLTLAGIFLCFPALRLLNTPENIIELSYKYLRILYMGVVVSMLYNLLAAILRAAGDSRTPLKAVVISSFCNMLFDGVFIIAFKWGIEGAAYATLLAQLVSAVYCLAVVVKVDCIRIRRGDWKPNKGQMKVLLKLGIPIGVQNIITAVGGVIVQRVINGFGILFIAGFTAANKLYGLLEIAASSYGYAVASYTGQNMGAGLIDRIKKGLKDASVLGIITAYLMSFVMLLFGKSILGFFVSGSESVVNATIDIGYTFLIILAVFFPLLYLLYILRACIQGMGDTMWPMISSVVQLFMRVLCALFLTRAIGQNGVFFGEILAWIGADLLLVCTYHYKIKDIKK